MFHIIPQSYRFSHGLCLNHFLQVLLICNQRDQFPPFGYINWAGEVYHLIRGSKVPRDMKYLMRPIKRSVEVVGIWTEDNWDVKRVG